MEDQAYQVQRMLADELDTYRGQGNKRKNQTKEKWQKMKKLF